MINLKLKFAPGDIVDSCGCGYGEVVVVNKTFIGVKWNSTGYTFEYDYIDVKTFDINIKTKKNNKIHHAQTNMFKLIK